MSETAADLTAALDKANTDIATLQTESAADAAAAAETAANLQAELEKANTDMRASCLFSQAVSMFKR